MPAFNTEKYIASCLQSIIAQTEINWELVVVDDYSTDSTFQILNKYAKLDSRIKVFSNEKEKGIIGALQTAYENISGNIITRMDADDLMTTDKLSLMKTLLLENGFGTLVLGQVTYFSDDKQLGEGYKQYELWLNSLTSSNNNFSEIYKECVIPSPAWMCWKQDFEKCNGFSTNIYPEDYDLAFRFYKANLNCIGTKKAVHYWRDYNDRTSRTDENYADNRFIDLKVKYFLALDYNKNKELILWGASKKGKSIAKLLIASNIEFTWICNNPNKIGRDIYGVILENIDNVNSFDNTQFIIAVAGNEHQKIIKQKLENKEVEKDNYFFFC